MDLIYVELHHGYRVVFTVRSSEGEATRTVYSFRHVDAAGF